MSNEQAATEASATSTEQNQAQNAAAAAESATAEQQASTDTSKPAEQEKGSAPAKEGELGEKGKQELIRLRKRAQEAERQAAYEKGQREATERLLAGKTSPQTPASADGYTVPRPVQGDSETFEDFTTRLSDWAYDRRQFIDRRKAESEKVKAQHQTIMVRAEAQRVAGEQKYPDFEERVSALDIPQALLNEVIESDIGHDLAYHFATHPDELKSISALPFNQQLKQLGRLEDKLKAGVVTQPQTKAPAPPPTVPAGGVTFDEKRYLSDDISTAERIKISQQRKAAQRKGQ